jgi:hypothetical protein
MIDPIDQPTAPGEEVVPMTISTNFISALSGVDNDFPQAGRVFYRDGGLR